MSIVYYREKSTFATLHGLYMELKSTDRGKERKGIVNIIVILGPQMMYNIMHDIKLGPAPLTSL